MSPNSYLSDGEQPYDDRHTPLPVGVSASPAGVPRCGFTGDPARAPYQLPPCVRHRGHLGQHDHTVHTAEQYARPSIQGYLEQLVSDGRLQNRAISPYRSDGVRVIRDGTTVALAVNETEAQRLVGGTAADPLWKSDVDRFKGQAEYWAKRCQEAERRINALPAEHARELTKIRDKHDRATRYIAKLKAEAVSDANVREIERLKRVIGGRERELDRLADAHRAAKVNEERFNASLLDLIRPALGQTTSGRQHAGRDEVDYHVRRLISQLGAARKVAENASEASNRWNARHGELIGDALHVLRRLNTIVGDRDAAEFTRAAGDEAVDKVLDHLKVTNNANYQLAERVEQLEQRLEASRAAAEVDRHKLEDANACVKAQAERAGRANERLDALLRLTTCPVTLEGILDSGTKWKRACVRVNGHDGSHLDEDGTAW